MSYCKKNAEVMSWLDFFGDQDDVSSQTLSLAGESARPLSLLYYIAHSGLRAFSTWTPVCVTCMQWAQQLRLLSPHGVCLCVWVARHAESEDRRPRRDGTAQLLSLIA